MNRRTLLGWAAALGFTSRMGMSATDSSMTSLLTLLEDAPREQLPARLAAAIREGLSREELLAALALAAARNVQPYPDVGFKYHAFMVLHATDSITVNLEHADAWLPLIWAADYFKRTQAEERRQSGWRMAESSGSGIMGKEAARTALIEALERWDRDAADTAIVNFARLASLEELFAVLFPYGARDLREIGHKAITVQNVHKLMRMAGPGQAEPLLRSAVAAILNPADDADPAQGDFPADRPWRTHVTLVERIPENWRQGRSDPRARSELLGTLREVSELEAGPAVVEMLRDGVSPGTAWEALYAAALELVMRRPSVVPVHAVTSLNALRHAFENSSDERTRRLMLLQGAAFIPMFRRTLGNANAELRIDVLEPVAPAGSGREAAENILSELPDARLRAASLALGYLEAGGSADILVARARHHLARKGDDAHAFKFAEAAFENARYSTGGWRNLLLAGSMVYLTGPAEEGSPAVEEAAALLQG